MRSAKIVAVTAWEALDSRGTPTVACEVRLQGGAVGMTAVPSGASTGTFEAVEVRDGGERYGGLGVQRAVRSVADVLGPFLLGRDASDQVAVDQALRDADSSPDLANLGTNAVLACSMATALANAEAREQPLWRTLCQGDPILPLPMVNIVSGGAHAGGTLDIQDVLVIPVGASSFTEAIEWAWRVRRGTVEALQARGAAAHLVADEGGLGPTLRTNRDAFSLVVEGADRAGLAPGEQVALAVDVAANQFWDRAHYRLAVEDRWLDADALIQEVASWCDEFPLVSIEDPLADHDWDGWSAISRLLGDRVQLLGDDLFVTSVERLDRGVSDLVANAILIKPNQVGTVTDAQRAVERAHSAGYATVVSARSGDTEHAWLADLAVAWGPGQIKVGSTTRSERTAKWNRLLQIEHHAGPDVGFAGRNVLAGSSDSPR